MTEETTQNKAINAGESDAYEDVAPADSYNEKGKKLAQATVSEEERKALLRRVLEETRASIGIALDLLGDIEDMPRHGGAESVLTKAKEIGKIIEQGDFKTVEGAFDGQDMVGPDGKKYAVGDNYASKSKLVEGDMLRLTILPDGMFRYKRIGPRKRIRLRGSLVLDQESQGYKVISEGRAYNVLTASVTYFKGQAGDEAIILVPDDKDSSWAAVENIIGKGPEDEPFSG